MNIVPPRHPAPAAVKAPKTEILVLGGAPTPAAQALNEPHPLESRIKGWRANEDALRLELLRQTQGPGEPIRRAMEAHIIEKATFVPQVLGGSSGTARDVLSGRDAEIDWEDVYPDDMTMDFHQELQERMIRS